MDKNYYLMTNSKLFKSSDFFVIKQDIENHDEEHAKKVMSAKYKSPILTFIFALVLSVLGIDCFYLKKYFKGILKIALWVLMIVIILVMISSLNKIAMELGPNYSYDDIKRALEASNMSYDTFLLGMGVMLVLCLIVFIVWIISIVRSFSVAKGYNFALYRESAGLYVYK